MVRTVSGISQEKTTFSAKNLRKISAKYNVWCDLPLKILVKSNIWCEPSRWKPRIKTTFSAIYPPETPMKNHI